MFIDEEQLRALEEKMDKRGYLEGSEMATTFNMLRANDLIWSFVVNNYLMGNEPFPFDLLYWNSDSTRMPAAMHSFYLRNMYQENLLCQPGGIALNGAADRPRPGDRAGLLPSTREDHIAPWKTTYRGTSCSRARTASCSRPAAISPAWSIRRRAANTATGSTRRSPADPESWLAGASEMAGSWWPDWQRWILAHDKEEVPARGCPAQAGCRRSSRPPAATSKSGLADASGRRRRNGAGRLG